MNDVYNNKSRFLMLALVFQGSIVLQAASDSDKKELKAIDITSAPRTYNGVQINKDTLYDLVDFDKKAPEQKQQKVNAWIASAEGQKVVGQLVPFHQFPNWRAGMQASAQLLAAQGIANKSKWNYVFQLPGDAKTFAKVSGPLNRLQSMLISKGIWPGQQVDLKKVLPKLVDTFQTASRAIYFLILKKYIDDNKLKHIKVKNTYLKHVPSSAKGVSDEQVIVLQDALPSKAKKVTGETASVITDDALKELISTIVGVGLWSMKDNLFAKGKGENQEVFVADLEQPNNSNPADFFHKNKVAYHGNVKAGLEELMKLFAAHSGKLKLIKDEINKNEIVNHPLFTQRYKNELQAVMQKIGN